MQKHPDKKSEESFISRWSRRKTDVANKPDMDALNTISESQSIGEVVVLADPNPEQTAKIKQNQEKVFTDEDMPPIDSLTDDSDFSIFMSPGVSDTLRNLALRKLFSGASFNIRDGLDDYDDDFRTFAGLGDLVTCDMKHQMEMEDDRKQEEAEAAEAVAESDSEATEENTADESESDERIGADPEVDAKAGASVADVEPMDDGDANKKPVDFRL